MKELVFNIESIFNSQSQNGCLSQYESIMYHIPAYQRGYKWSSEDNGAVTILLEDLLDGYKAFKNQERSEYYLQYITVKKTSVDSLNCLEVIDGQQRLTTLSILLSIFSLLLKKENISENKLHYAIRDNFFKEHIYPRSALKKLINISWNDLKKDGNYNKQDIYYLFNAAKKCHIFLENIELETKVNFYNYICENVKLIVNSVEKHVESETVFKNLNSNQVPLTESELIKGLLITKVGRIRDKKNNLYFKEILEIRANIGRKWDEISQWANSSEIRTFYFNNKSGLHQLLLLTALQIDDIVINQNSNNSLFNAYHKLGKPDLVFQKLKDTYDTLNDWYDNTEFYNLIGFCRFVKKSSLNNLDFLRELLDKKDKQEIKKFLLNKKSQILSSDKKYKDLKYGEDDNDIHAILLALNVFVKGLEKRFDFYAFVKKKWSLEHIFPQSPEGKSNILSSENKEEIINILDHEITPEIKEVLKLDTRTDSEKEIYYRALQESNHLNSIGNMCLLTSSDNSSNGCMFFYEKRKNILGLIQKGSFVPKHTFDVFSKMLGDMNNYNLSIWNRSDIEQHIEYIQDQFE
mgnify:CR=1 FL=1